MARFRLFALSAPVAVVCLLLTVLTLPGVPASVAGWADVFAFVSDAPLRWVLPVVGWVGLALLAVFLWRRTRAHAPVARHTRAAPSRDASGARPRRATVPTTTPRGSAPIPASMAGWARDALLDEYRRGEQLVAGNQRPPLSASMSVASRQSMPPLTTAADVEAWEKRVVHLLHRAERWELEGYFLAEVPTAPTPTTGELMASARSVSVVASLQAGGPWSVELERRLDFRLAQLNTIIKRRL